MPRLIAPGSGTAFDIDALVDALDAHPFDTRDEDSFADAGPLLARLGRNPHFLADLAIAELKDRCAGQVATNGYSAQVVLLRPPSARYVLRANFWPAATDDAVRSSGAEAFFYGDAHDHNFPFLTYGYLGPGYWSDYYERDPAAILGLPGERAHLRFVERARLEPGRLMLYRQRLDVHRQLPPEAFSVSLNILGHDPAQPWIDQYRFDIDTDTVVGGLTVAPSEALLALAVQFGNGIDVVETLARRHPFARMRTTALDALLGAGQGHALAEEAVADSDRLVAAHARRRLAAIEATGSDAIAA
ncbi:transposase [Sphingomonas donggukensis]|uniref:Transposase n=1 Tax=Sphingomonas donggukensis TaxID=2949093 RepID=A0ABY4TWW3_9SPHN|nr:transposase [Sphingomonas donggukensis]URW75649.1 transposase [Sphingomonas donggukensis]